MKSVFSLSSIKPRSEAMSMDVKKIESQESPWQMLDTLGDRRSFYVLEKYVPGDIFHADSIVSERDLVFCIVSKCGKPPMPPGARREILT